MDRNLILNLLAQWRNVLGDKPRCEVVNPTKLVCQITSTQGDAYLLKEVGDIERRNEERLKKVEADIAVLRHLSTHAVPVALPVMNDQGRAYTLLAGHFFTLSPVLPSNFDETAANLNQVFRNLGVAVARLHIALADYPGKIRSWRMDLPRRILLQAVPSLEKHLEETEILRLNYAVESLREPMNNFIGELPVQPIHGDLHGGNVLFDGECVSGFIDLDHLPVGPRVWDLGYFLADWVKNRYRSPAAIEPWFTLLPELLRGYQQEIRLSRLERESISYIMLGVQLIFAEYFFSTAIQPSRARFNLEAFHWIYDNMAKIQSILISTRSLQ